MSTTLKIKTFLLLLLVLLIPLSGMVEGFKDGMNPNHSLYKDGIRVYLRKLPEVASLLDYDDAGANTKHDPRKKPGNGKNP
ncbi:protein PSY [Fagus crenata]